MLLLYANSKIKEILPGTGGSHLEFYLLRRQRSGRLLFEASLGE
jgi:hypothetical protein